MAHLHSVKLRGFKTFAKPVELSFEPGVTVIIGPNGSGKSNIADGVLWVLGEQSPGNLRGRTMQDIIFTGPDGRKSSAVAEVSLVFDNECGSFPLDCSQIEVTRRLVRDGGSEYRLNGAACRLLDVQDLVGGLGLGREMHSVVSQGKVEALLDSTPEARKALIEEAAGLGRFKKRRERAQAKLERTRQNLLRVSDVEREVKAALRPLKQQVAAAERFVGATEDWAFAKAKWALLSLTQVEEFCREKNGRLARLKARLEEIDAQLLDLRRRRVSEEERFNAALREREDLGAAFHGARAEAERMEGRSISLRQRVVRLEGESDRARRRRELARTELAVLEARLEEATAGTADEARLHVVENLTLALRDALDESLPAHRDLVAREDDLKDSVFELEAARSRAVHEREFLRKEVEEKSRVGSELAALVEAARVRLDEMEAETGALERQRATGESALRETVEAFKAASALRDESRASAVEVARQETSLIELIAGLESRQAVLCDLLERREGMSAGARELMASDEGCRLLTEALAVEPGYERALAAALGPLIQAVVLHAPTELLHVLRAEGPLEAVWESSEPVAQATVGSSRRLESKPPPGTRDLWEMVTGSDALKETLRALVPPTAVVVGDSCLDDIAIDDCEGSWCLVTRLGERVQPGLHVARRREVGAEALLRARYELKSATEERSALDVRLEAARKAAAVEDGAARRAEARVAAGETSLREAEHRLASQRNECDLHKRRVEEALAQFAELQLRQSRETDRSSQVRSDVAVLEEAMAGREVELDKARSSLRGLQAQLEAMRKTVGRLEEKKSQAALLEVRLRERYRAQESERARARAQHKTASDDAARCERRAASLDRYVPVLIQLLGITEKLAEQSRTLALSLESRVQDARARSEGAAAVMRDRGGTEAELQREHDALAAESTQICVDEARLDDRRSLLEEELAGLRRRHLSPRALKPADVAGEDADALEAAIGRAERRREKIGPVNPLAEQECAEMEERATFLGEQRRDLEDSLSQLRDVIKELDEHIDGTFAEIFEACRGHFAAVIATVFPGAKGNLRLIESAADAQNEGAGGNEAPHDGDDGDDGRVRTQGIVLEVRLPNKAPRSMSLLSGGEKAMTAIAFLFSLFLSRPCPFYILDEVEASLDDVNIRRFLSLVRKYRDRTQFIIITHQRQTMEVADTLYGIALESDGTSRVLSRRLGEKKAAGNNQQRKAIDMMPRGA